MPGTAGNSGTNKWVSVPKIPPQDAPPYDEPMETEGTKQFKCFQVWLQMEEDERSLVKVSREMAVSRTRLSVYAKTYRWGERASAYDRERRLYRASKRNAKLLKTRDSIVRVASDRFNDMLPQELTASEALRFVEVADKMDRLDSGDATEITREDIQEYRNVSVKVFQFLLDGVSDEWAERARPLLEEFEAVFGITPKDPGMELPALPSKTS